MSTATQSLEDSHKTIQDSATVVLGLSVKVVEMAYQLGKAFEQWKASLPQEKTLEQAAEKQFSPDLQAWLQDYLTIAAMPLAENITESKPRHIQQAMKLLQLIPPILITKDNNNDTKTKKTD